MVTLFVWFCFIYLFKKKIFIHFYSLQFPFGSDSGSADHPLEFESSSDDSSGSSSESARRLIRGLLTVDPPKRVRSLRTLKNHAFYHHFDFEALGSKKVRYFFIKFASTIKSVAMETLTQRIALSHGLHPEFLELKPVSSLGF
jgi:hypothetical protein